MAREFEKVRVTFKSICMNYNSHIGYLNAYFLKKSYYSAKSQLVTNYHCVKKVLLRAAKLF